jgi:hypothetical protein
MSSRRSRASTCATTSCLAAPEGGRRKAKIELSRPRRPKSICRSSRPVRPTEASDDEADPLKSRRWSTISFRRPSSRAARR